MDKTVVDSEGTEIHVGDIVAFNYSGEVRRGKVLEVHNSWKERPYIKNSYYFTGKIIVQQATRVSIVRNPSGILILSRSID